MSRKRTKATAKPKAKKTATKATPSVSFKIAETMEKDFRAAPAKIVAQYGKDLAVLRQQEKKLVNELTKADAKHKSSKTKTATLATKANAKKQWIVAKKLTDSLHKTVSELTTKLSTVKNLCKMLMQKQAKFTSLNKQLVQIEKQLDAKAKKPKATTAKRTKKAVKQASPQKTTNTFESTIKQQPEATSQMTIEEVEEVN